ncbi:MAG: hypothetical protein HYU36_03370 [Planctomycetes bacterium]|nr:hypothetical protein [Planctomycetota bacterium]
MSTPMNPRLVHALEEFGPVGSAEEIRQAFGRAVESLGQSGGILLIPGEQARHVRTENTTQRLLRTPPPPAQTKEWKAGPGVTLIESGAQNVQLRVPQMSGLHIARTLRMDPEGSLQHWRSNPIIQMDNRVIHGSNSYLDWLQEAVEKGRDRRFYLATVRGIRPGQFLNAHEGPGMKGGVARLCVKSVGYDAAKKLHYLVADTDLDHIAGAILQNKNNVGLLRMNQTANSDEQTYDVVVNRYQYAHGDTYIFFGGFSYMSNIHSAYGDENGVIYGAFTHSLTNAFRGRVETVDAARGQVRFALGSVHAETLANSRPLVNLNPNKWTTQGRVWIVPAESYWKPVDTGKYPFQGKTYPTVYPDSPLTGQAGFTVDELTLKDGGSDLPGLRMGGLIRGGPECPWTEGIVGRFFAVTEESELVYPSYAIPIHREREDVSGPYYSSLTGGGVLRWYRISSLRQNPDGTKDIEIERFWSGARTAGSPTLFDFENYTWDAHLRPLRYAIAPGTYVLDVSRAVPGESGESERLLGLAPHGDAGTAMDFEPGDEVEQAIGPDPFKPVAFRAWLWDHVPGAWPSPVMDVSNWGASSRYAALAVRGLGRSLEEVQKRQEKKPAWDKAISLEAACTVGIDCKADFADAAILFEQPYREQPIKWRYDHRPGRPPQEAILTVSTRTGELRYQGGGMRLPGPLSEVQGLSGSPAPARNLRGKNVPVEPGAISSRIQFDRPESDADYAVLVEQSWLSSHAVSEKSAEGFLVAFDRPAPRGATLDWMMVR